MSAQDSVRAKVCGPGRSRIGGWVGSKKKVESGRTTSRAGTISRSLMQKGKSSYILLSMCPPLYFYLDLKKGERKGRWGEFSMKINSLGRQKEELLEKKAGSCPLSKTWVL